MTPNSLFWLLPVFWLLLAVGGIVLYSQRLWFSWDDYLEATKPFQMVLDATIIFLAFRGAIWWLITLLKVLYGG